LQEQESWPHEPVVHTPRRRRRPMRTMAGKLGLPLFMALLTLKSGLSLETFDVPEEIRPGQPITILD
jgi:hypothetical protein